MVPNTALGFLLSGTALILLLPNKPTPARRLIGQILASGCLILAVITLLEYLEFWPESHLIDEILLNLFPAKPFVFRPSPHTSLNFFLVGISLLLLGTKRIVFVRTALWLALVALILPILVLFGYIYRQAAFYAYSDLIGMALPTAISFIALATSILLARPRVGLMKVVTDSTVGGQVIRRLLPAVMLVPLILGWMILYGESLNLYSHGCGLALLQVLTVLIMSGMILHVASVINHEEYMKKAIEADLRRSEDNLREFALHLENARERERLAVARDIHDEIGNMLAALKMDAGLLSSKLKQMDIDQSIFQRLDKTTIHINRLIQTVRRIISDLRPSILDNLGLMDSIEWQLIKLKNDYGIQYKYEKYLNEEQLKFQDDAYYVNLFRIFQEITTNIVKHSKASMVTVFVANIEDFFVMSVSDNGIGMPANQPVREDAFGLISIRERAYSMKGKCCIVSKEKYGTTIVISIPLDVKKNDGLKE